MERFYPPWTRTTKNPPALVCSTHIDRFSARSRSHRPPPTRPNSIKCGNIRFDCGWKTFSQRVEKGSSSNRLTSVPLVKQFWGVIACPEKSQHNPRNTPAARDYKVPRPFFSGVALHVTRMGRHVFKPPRYLMLFPLLSINVRRGDGAAGKFV